MPFEFLLFAVTLIGVAFHPGRAALAAFAGTVFITGYKTVASPFREGAGLAGLEAHFAAEWVSLANLLAMLVGFALLAGHFEKSRAALALRRYLPQGWQGGFFLLIGVAVIASFIDNIAAAMMGGAMARTVFRGKVHVGYLVAIVAAANAGGAGSVIGDTTTTMMWIAGVAPREIFTAYLAGGVALLVAAVPAALQQHALSPLARNGEPYAPIEWGRIAVVGFILITAVAVNLLLNLRFNGLAHAFPVLGLSVLVAILVMTPLRRPDWDLVPAGLRGALFLLALVWCASLMPVERLPAASPQGTLAIGFVSALFDNIPFTALALKRGGFDWGFLAYAVGFGGSMMWFGSSAGVALANMFPEAKSAQGWLRHGWHVVLAYVSGFVAMYCLLGWHPGTHPVS